MVTVTEFEQWKSELEDSSDTCYVKSSGMKVVSGVNIDYYYCNRSGFYESEGRGMRTLKSQGTSKIHSYCTAKILLHQSGKDSSLETEETTTHYGHSILHGHLRLSKEQRRSIAGQLMQGVSVDSILDKVRENIGTKLQRINLLVKKDIYNIERAFHVRGSQMHPIDSVSVQIWVKEMEKRFKENPVLLFKRQGKIEADVGTSNGLKENDFALVIQTPLQSEMLQSCGDKKVICLDATHGTNAYDFQLISVLVVDEFGEGFPVGWCFTNREDKTLLMNFFNHLKQRAGNICPQWLMSDDAEQYYSAWVATFQGKPTKLLCNGMLIGHGVEQLPACWMIKRPKYLFTTHSASSWRKWNKQSLLDYWKMLYYT